MRSIVLGVVILSVVGCSEGPKAPILSNSPIYQNEGDRFRLLIPDEWRVNSMTRLPNETIDRLRLLAQYQRIPPAKPANFEISRIDPIRSEDYEKLMGEASHLCTEWKKISGPEERNLAGVNSRFYRFSGMISNQKSLKEVTAFELNGHHYFLVGLYRETDQSARDQYKRIVDSLVWE